MVVKSTPPIWPSPTVQRIVSRVVSRKLPLFGGFPDLSREDLLSESLIAARDAHETFEFGRNASYVTHIYRAANCQLLDLYRKRSRHKGWEDRAGEIEARRRVESAEQQHRPAPPAEELLQQLRNVYVVAKRAFPVQDRRKDTRKWATPAHVAACRWLKNELKLSIRGMHLLLKTREDLRVTMEMPKVPSLNWIGSIDVHTYSVRFFEKIPLN